MSVAPASPHVLIPDAVLALPAGAAQPPWPELPTLRALVGHLRPSATLALDDDSPATPFEVALARAHGLPDEPGRTPWAAFEAGVAGTPCAWLQPCHWQMGMNDVSVLHPGELGLDEHASRALLASVEPLLRDDGLTLRYLRPDAWLVQGELLRGLSCWSLRRALTRPVTRQQLAQAPTEAQRRTLRRLQSEWQMLLYTHPVNEAREGARRWPVNALWIGGAGELPQANAPRADVQVCRELLDLPARLSLHDWQRAWQAIDANALAPLLQTVRGGAPARLTLCGPRRALTLSSAQGLTQKIMSQISPLRLSNLRDQL